MQVSVEATGSLERRVEISVPAGEVESAFKARLKSFSRTARLKGFRPGKAPLAVVQRQFGPQIRDEVVSELVRVTLANALNQQKLAPVAGPRIDPLPPASGGELRYAAVFEVYPEIELKGLEQIEIARPSAEVGSGDVAAMIENLRGQRPNYVAATRPAADGDRLTVDFDGRVDGVAFEGGHGENVTLVLGSGRMLKDFEAGLNGVAEGETRTYPVSFPAGYGKAELAGKSAEFTVTVRKLEERQLPPIDDEFCAAYGVASGGIEQLRREVEENMRRELADNVRGRIKVQMLDKLLAANPLELPRVAVDNQIRSLQIDWLRRMGTRPEDLKQAPPREPFEAAARRRVAVGLLLGEVIRREAIKVDPVRLTERVESAAAGYADPDEAAKQIRANDELRAQLQAAVLEDQAIEYLLTRVKLSEQPSTFKELLKFGA